MLLSRPEQTHIQQLHNVPRSHSVHPEPTCNTSESYIKVLHFHIASEKKSLIFPSGTHEMVLKQYQVSNAKGLH